MRIVSDKAGWWLTGLHGLMAVGWLAMMPGGFATDHPRFWVNRALPVLFVALCVGVGIRGWRGDRLPLRGMLALLATFWTAVIVTMFAVYPVSAWRVMTGLVPVGTLLWLSAFAPSVRGEKLRPWVVVMAVGLGMGAGAFVPLAQRAPYPGTRPLNEPLPQVPDSQPESGSVVIGEGARVTPGTGEIGLLRGRYVMTIDPLLTFTSRSPDRCWTNLAPARDRVGPARVLRNWGRDSDGWIRARYVDDDQSVLQVRALADGAIEVCAWSRLPKDVFSHLNTYSQIFIAGHKRLELAFSPCGDRVVEPRYMEYPVGAPARCAALFAGGRFAVLQASSAEKGPYIELASGWLTRSEPLTVTMRDEGNDVVEVTWLDFPAQASTDLSPTAGYGLPVNAIEFSLTGKEPASPMGMFVTLAGTSVGRGWDSVGHGAGVYRNRMRVRWLTR